MSSPARLLDGIQPHPFLGSVCLEEDGIRFTTEEGSVVKFPLESIRRLDTVAGEFLVEVEPLEGGVTPAQIFVLDESFAQILDEFMDRHLDPQAARAGRFFRKIPGWCWLLLAVVILPVGFILATRGASLAHRFIPVETEVQLGEYIYGQVTEDWVVCEDEELRQKIQDLVDTLADEDSPYDYRVSLFETKEPNAFAVPGGHILVLSGLFELCDDPGALAGVLAHEIAHIDQRHTLKQLLRSLGLITFMGLAVGGGVEQLEPLEALVELSSLALVFKYSREAEEEADALSIERLHRHGISVNGSIKFFRAVQEKFGLEKVENVLAWASTHPETPKRIECLQKVLEAEPKYPAPACLAEFPDSIKASCPELDVTEM